MRLSAAVILCFAIMYRVSAGAKPNLSGEWRMKIDKSSRTPFIQLTYTVVHAEPNLRYLIVGQSDKYRNVKREYRCTTDGRECKTQVNEPEAKGTIFSRMNWVGSVLVVKGTSDRDDRTFEQEWSLSSDGRLLTVVSRPSGRRGPSDDSVLVFERR